MPVDLSAGNLHGKIRERQNFPSFNTGNIPSIYRQLFDMINAFGIEKITQTVFVSLFESNLLTQPILNQVCNEIQKLEDNYHLFVQIWTTVVKNSAFSSRNDLYKSLALMALSQQGRTIDERILDNYGDRGDRYLFEKKDYLVDLDLPVPTIDNITDLENRLIRLLRSEQGKTSLCFRYGDLCSLDTIQINVAPEKKGINTK